MRIHGRVLAAFVGLVFGFSGIAHAEWRKAESPHFVVYSEASEANLRETTIKLERFHAILLDLSGNTRTEEASKLHVFLFPGSSGLREVVPGIGRDIGGFYYASPDRIAAFAINDDNSFFPGIEIIQHEYTHHFMFQYYPGAYPFWFVEGFAEYFATVDLLDDGFQIGKFSQGRAVTLTQTSWTPMKTVLTGQRGKLSREQISGVYAQGWLLVHYFLGNGENRQKLLRYLKEIGEGAPNNEETWQRATGLTFPELDRVLRAYKSKAIISKRVTQPWPAPPAISVQSMGKGAGERIVLEERLRFRRGRDDKGTGLAKAKQVLARDPESLSAQLLAARAEVTFGDAAAGRSLAQAVVAAQPQNAEAHYLIGLSLMEEGRKDENVQAQKFKEARPALARAFKYDPNHVGALYQTGLSLMANGDMNENTANIFMLAHQLAPQVGEISIDAAQAMVSLGKKQEAIALLQPVANNPHGGKLSERAQALLDGVLGVVPTENTALDALAPG